MSVISQINGVPSAISRSKPAMLAMAILFAAAALVALASVPGNAPVAQAQANPACDVIDLGTLDAEGDAKLQTDSRWTTRDCNSRFLTNSDAHTYSFRLPEDGRVRIDLKSADGDSYLHLMTEDGSRIAHDDDTGPALDSRIEFSLAAGAYLVEAASGAGRGRGPADYTLSIGRATGCEQIDLGILRPGVGLAANGVWTLDDCGARFREDTPAHTFRFELPQEGLVRIDLTAPEGGDPYVYLLSLDGSYIYSDDDDGAGRNSRIENDLAAGAYLIEATTYGDRDHVHELTDFDLTIRLVDDDAFRIKAEALHLPDQVVAGEPVTVHYRVGNAGRANLPDGYSAVARLVARRAYETTDPINASDGRWQAGVSYHTGQQTASLTSDSISEATPFEITFPNSGYAWAFLGVVTYDEAEEEVGFHGILKELVVLSGYTFPPVTVKVDDSEYEVSAEADADGMVTVSVTGAADAAAVTDETTRAKAIYAAGVRARMLDGIFERPAIAGLPTDAEPQNVSVENPLSDTLISAFAGRYASAVAAAGLRDSLEAGETLYPTALEDLVLGEAETASAQFAYLAASWKALQQRIEDGDAPTADEAFAVHSQLAYAERVLSPMIKAGDVVRAARAADQGWEDASVQAMSDDMAERASCRGLASALRGVLQTADAEDVARLLELDAEARAALPIFGVAADSVLCAATAADFANSRFLEGLAIADNDEILRMLGQEPPQPVVDTPTPTYQLRIIARVGEDSRVELGVDPADGERILPTVRHLPADAAVDRWLISSGVEADDVAIGKIRARRLADGRIELSFLSAGGEIITPDIRYLPADAPTDVWLRSGEIEVPLATTLE